MSRILPIIPNAEAREGKARIQAKPISQLLAGEDNCSWKVWLQSNYVNYPRIKGDGDLADWEAKHTALLEKTRTDLLQRGHEVFTEGQNEFNLEGGAGFVSGKCDLVSKSQQDVWTILDPKTGKRKASHVIQVKLYMWLLPFVTKYAGIKFNGAVVYKDGSIPIPHESITPEFIAQAKAKIAELGSDSPPARVPSRYECRYCSIPSMVCPDRYDENAGAVKVDVF